MLIKGSVFFSVALGVAKLQIFINILLEFSHCKHMQACEQNRFI